MPTLLNSHRSSDALCFVLHFSALSLTANRPIMGSFKRLLHLLAPEASDRLLIMHVYPTPIDLYLIIAAHHRAVLARSSTSVRSDREWPGWST